MDNELGGSDVSDRGHGNNLIYHSRTGIYVNVDDVMSENYDYIQLVFLFTTIS